MVRRYSITTYHFSQPLPPKRSEYLLLKAEIAKNPSVNIAPERDLWSKFSPIGLIIAGIFFIPLFFILPSLTSYKRYLDERDAFFLYLKSMISTSEDYPKFINSYSKKYPQAFLGSKYFEISPPPVIDSSPLGISFPGPRVNWQEFRKDHYN